MIFLWLLYPFSLLSESIVLILLMSIFSFHLTLRSTDSCCFLIVSPSPCFCPQSQEAKHSWGLHVAEGDLCVQGKEREREGVGLGQEGFRSQHRWGGQDSSSSTMGWSKVVPALCFFPHLQKIKMDEKEGIYEDLERGWDLLFLPAVPATPCLDSVRMFFLVSVLWKMRVLSFIAS